VSIACAELGAQIDSAVPLALAVGRAIASEHLGDRAIWARCAG